VDEAKAAEVDFDAVVLSDWNVDASGRIKGRVSRSRIAADGQPSEPFEPLNNQFPMDPGARFELMFDTPRNLGAGVRLALRGDAGAADHLFIAIVPEGEPVDARSESPWLAANPRLPAEIALESARRRDFAISGGGSAPFAINGATFVDWAPKPAYVIPRGQAAVFALANKTAVVQAIRLWGHVARLLHSMDDGREPYWRHPHPARSYRPCRVRRRQPGQMAARSGDPRAPRSRSGTWFQVG
jgi:hypothetical protein